MSIKYKEGLELWVWDSGKLEGFALYMNGQFLDEQVTTLIRYPINEPSALVVQFAGVDGGATKVVDTTGGNVVLEHQDSGMKHAYLIVD